MSSRSPTPPPHPMTFVKVSCHCGLNVFRAGFITSDLPISNDLCHCSSCRHSSGQMAVYHVTVATLLCEETDDPFHAESGPLCSGDGDLVAYHTSDDGVRYFCSSCSAQLLFRYLGKPGEGQGGERGEGYYRVAAGALERVEGIVQPGYHIWVEDTLDGGFADHLTSINGKDMPRCSQEAAGMDEVPLGWKHESILQVRHDDTRLHFACHCKAVQFHLTRPSPLSTFPHSAYPDLLYPHDATRLATVRNSEDVKWWLRPLGTPQPTKYFAGHCACRYCRLASGFEIQSWAYVPLSNIVDKNEAPFTLFEEQGDELNNLRATVDELGLTQLNIPRKPILDQGRHKLAGLKQYISSPGRYREFCQKCGATVFGWQAGRPDLICVAVALVDERQNGSRAEEWFEWCMDRVGFAEQAVAPETIRGVYAGLRSFKSRSVLPPTSNILAGTVIRTGTRPKNATRREDPSVVVIGPDSIQVEA